jgi:hypothetical protein
MRHKPEVPACGTFIINIPQYGTQIAIAFATPSRGFLLLDAAERYSIPLKSRKALLTQQHRHIHRS